MIQEEAAWEEEERHANQLYAQRFNKISSYLKRHGSLYAEEVAEAVMATKTPELLAAIALRESNANPNAVGDRGLSLGAFQIQKKWWGHVSPDVFAQARQAEKVVDILLMRHNGSIYKALCDYNNDNSGRYARFVLAKMEEML